MRRSRRGSWIIAYLSRRHHHTTTDGVQGVGSDTSTSSNSPAEHERSKEVTLKGTNEEDRLDRVVHAEVQTTVDHNTQNGRTETTVETSNTIGGKGLLVYIDQTVELTGTSTLGTLGVVGETSTGVVEGVDEEERSGTGGLMTDQQCAKSWAKLTYTTGSQVAHHPLSITVSLLLESEHGLVGVAESEVEGLCREITDDVGGVTTPQRHDTFGLSGSAEAVHDAGIFAVETACLQHLIL